MSKDSLDHVFLAGHPVSDRDHHAAADVACDGAAQNNGREGKRPLMVIDTPRTRTQGNLETGVKVEDDNDGNEKTVGEGVVGVGFVRFVEGVRFGEFRLVVDEASLLDVAEDAEFILFVFGCIAPFDVDVDLAADGKVVFVLEGGKFPSFANSPGQMGIMSDENHVVSVDCSEGSQSVTHNGEESYQDVVDNVDHV